MSKHLGTDKSGSVSVLFAVTLLPMLLGVGAAVDYSRAATMRTKLQTAADAAALALSKEAAKKTDAELQAMGEKFFEGAFASTWDGSGPVRRAGEFTRTDLKVVKSAKRISIAVDGQVDTMIMRLAGIVTMPMAARSEAGWGTRRIEVALVLDNTGSMAGTKITELRKASTDLVNILANVATDPDSVKIGLVPFATQVRLDTSLLDEPWIDYSVNGVTKATWNGCVQDRDQPYDASDDLQRIDAMDASAKPHPAVKTCAASTLAPVAPLTTNFTSLTTAIGKMAAGGNTNITIGLAWGQALLSPGAPLTGAAAFGTPDVEKFMIMLTDGDNTQNRWTSNQSQIDARTVAACNAVKSATKKITLYTVRVVNGNAALLKACATSPAHYKDVQNANQLNAVFQAIAAEIASIRLTM